jgi:CHAT domain-containing protein
MRAQFEEIYALHWLQKSSLCAAKTLALIPELLERKYLWLLIQVQLERFVCTNALEDSRAAEAALKLASPIAQQADYGTVYLRGVGFTAFLETQNGNRRTAWSLNRQGLTKYWSGLYPSVRANQFYSDLCSDAEEQANWQLALPLAREALKFAVDDGDTSFEAISRYRLANDALMAGSTDEGLDQFARAHLLFDSMPQDSTTTIYRAYSELFPAKRELRNGDLNTMEESVKKLGNTLPGISNDLIAMDFYRTWGELERRHGNTSEAQWALAKAIQIAEKRLQSLTNVRQRLTWNREVGSIYRSLVETQLRQMGDAEGALELWEWYRGAALRNMRHMTLSALNGEDGGPEAGSITPSASRLLAMGGVRRSLPFLSSHTVVSYAQLADGLAIWVYDDRGVVENWVSVSKEDLGQLAENFRELCQDPHSDPSALRESAHRLYELLIAPIEKQLQHNRALVVEPDNLGEVPFRALLDASGQYLGDAYEVVISPGLLYRQNPAPSLPIVASDRAFVVGSPASGEAESMSPEPLPDANAEAAAVAARFQRSTLLSGREATLIALQRNLPNNTIFHFAGHASASADGVSLLLARSTFSGEKETANLLTADHVGTMRLGRYKLVVLSACETAQGGEIAVADPENLVGAFLSAGVGNVVASRWKVDSASTAVFMDSLYGALLSGQSVAAALKSAALDLRRQPGRGHPFYWAAFENYGGI